MGMNISLAHILSIVTCQYVIDYIHEYELKILYLDDYLAQQAMPIITCIFVVK